MKTIFYLQSTRSLWKVYGYYFLSTVNKKPLESLYGDYFQSTIMLLEEAGQVDTQPREVQGSLFYLFSL
jgi:hypothetical protein